MSRFKVSSPLLLIARIWTSIVLAFLFIMVGGTLISDGFPNFSDNEGLSFLFFPVLVTIGLALTWKWRIPGSIITLVSMIIFFFLMSGTGNNWIFYVIAAPALLFPIEKIIQADK